MLGVRQANRLLTVLEAGLDAHHVHLAGALERCLARVLERVLPLAVEVLGVGDHGDLVVAQRSSRMRGIIPCVCSFDHALIRGEVQRPRVQRELRAGRVVLVRSHAAWAEITPGHLGRHHRTASRARRVSPVAPREPTLEGARQAVGRVDDVTA